MYKEKNFENLLGTPGFSDALLKNHFTLYGGYVKNVNKFIELLKTKEHGTPEYAELKRRFGWEWNGMKLHELYFGNMSPRPSSGQATGVLADKIKEQFGSHEAWDKDFRATGGMRGIGWVILAYDKESDELFNIWIDEHDVGHLAGATPLLVLDVFEHAYVTDYGIKRGDYIDAFFNAIDWETVSSRFTG